MNQVNTNVALLGLCIILFSCSGGDKAVNEVSVKALEAPSKYTVTGVEVGNLSLFSGFDAAHQSKINSITPSEYKFDFKDVEIINSSWERAVDSSLAGELQTEFFKTPTNDNFTSTDLPENIGEIEGLQSYFGPLWYKKNVSLKNGKKSTLRLNKVNYYTDVSVNDEYLGRHEGFLSPVDVLIKDSEEANILLQIQHPLDPPTELDTYMEYKSFIMGTFQMHDSRYTTSDTKGATQREKSSPVTGGIMDDVSLIYTLDNKIRKVFVTPRDSIGNLELTILSENLSGGPLKTDYYVNINSPEGKKVGTHKIEVEEQPGVNRTDLDVVIDNPQVWEINSALGNPNLYTVEVASYVNDEHSDSETEVFGIRTIDWKKKDQSPEFYEKDDAFGMYLNGSKRYVKAVNYMPKEMFAKTDKSFYEKDMELLKEANLNSIGVHAQVQSKYLYEVANEKGMTIFQDFPLQWFYLTGSSLNPTFVTRAKHQIAEMMYSLWNHPSIVYWTTHNEPGYVVYGHMMMSIMKSQGGHPPHVWEELLTTEAAKMFKMTPEMDSPQVDFSNINLDKELVSTARTVDKNRYVNWGSGYSIDDHDYYGSISGGELYDSGSKTSAPFMSEYGVSHIGAKVMEGMDWPLSEKDFNDASRGGISMIHQKLGGPMSAYNNANDWAKAQGIYKRHYLKFTTEHFRSNRNNPWVGHRLHFFVNNWGYTGMGLLDVDRKRNQHYEAYKSANRNQTLVFNNKASVFAGEDVNINLFAINDKFETWKGDAKLIITKLDSVQVLHYGSEDKNALPSTLAAVMMPLEGQLVVDEENTGEEVVNETLPFEAKAQTSVNFATLNDKLSNGAYRAVLTFTNAEGKEETNSVSFIVVPKGWEAPYGLNWFSKFD